MSAPPRFATVVLDVDSTLSAIEGIDWLASRRGAVVGARVAELTERAMRGAIALDSVYGERLALVRPERSEIDALALAYIEGAAPDASEALALLRGSAVRLVVVSGGLREAIAPFAAALGVGDADVHAVGVRFDGDDRYAGYDEGSPLATASGKRTLVESLSLPRPVLAVGDGATDLAIRPAVAAFAAYTGFVRRDAIVGAADHVVESFTSLTELVLG